MPLYQHTCNFCRHIKTVEGKDLYICDANGETYLSIRFSSRPIDIITFSLHAAFNTALNARGLVDPNNSWLWFFRRAFEL